MKKVSVIIPCYNAAQYIDCCMESLLSQTMGFNNIEVILVNDCSTDSTLGKLLKYESEHPDDIVVIPLEENVKQGKARNIALEYATGEYVDYLDADDYLVPNALEKLYRIARQNDADFVEYLQQDVYAHDTELHDTKTGEKDIFRNIRTADDKREFFLSGNVLRSCADKFYKRSFIAENGLHYAEGCFDEESLFTVMATVCCKKYYKLQEKLYCYFQNPEGTCFSMTHDIQRRDDNARVWLTLLEEIKEKGLLNDIRDEFELAFVENYLVRSVRYSHDRGIDMDTDAINEMIRTVRFYFPDYDKNRYADTDPVYAGIVSLLGKELTKENKDKFIEFLSRTE